MPKLTIRAIEAALRKAPAEGESYLSDSEAPGLGLRIRGGANLDERERRAAFLRRRVRAPEDRAADRAYAQAELAKLTRTNR